MASTKASLLDKGKRRPINFPSRVKALELTKEGVRVLDQTTLPGMVRYHLIKTPEVMVAAIKTMVVRGAPAIGIAGAFGVVLSARLHEKQAKHQPGNGIETFRKNVLEDAYLLRKVRPTAVNLAWAIDQMLPIIQEADSISKAVAALTQKAETLFQADVETNQKMGHLGAELLPRGARILTHCNAGALATAGYGTALGIIRSAYITDPTIKVYANETRPRLQGARLTAWELTQDNIPVTVVTDSMSGHLMKSGLVDVVIVGADRIAANGDVANKIGTYTLALVAHLHQVPFYVAAPTSTIDLATSTGEEIPIEERSDEEIWNLGGLEICPAEGVSFCNPAFDVTPARYISAIITEKGIARPSYEETLPDLLG